MPTDTRPLAIAIMGPTASGKSAVAEALAAPGEADDEEEAHVPAAR